MCNPLYSHKTESTFGKIDVDKPTVTVGVLLGSTGETIAKKYLPNAKIKTYKGGGRMIVQALLAGHVDAGVNDDLAVLTVLPDFPPKSVRLLDKRLGKAKIRWPLPCAMNRSTCGSGSTCTSSLPAATAPTTRTSSTGWNPRIGKIRPLIRIARQP
jgi:hypothetical protein